MIKAVTKALPGLRSLITVTAALRICYEDDLWSIMISPRDSVLRCTKVPSSNKTQSFHCYRFLIAKVNDVVTSVIICEGKRIFFSLSLREHFLSSQLSNTLSNEVFK